MPPICRPSALNATPRNNASSRKVPSWLFISISDGVESQATKMSGQPSPSASKLTTVRPSDRTDARLPGDVAEGAVAVVAIKIVLRLGQAKRSTKGCYTLVVAVRHSQRWFRSGRKVDIDVVRDKEIEQPIAVVIQE